ncbi:MAG: endonuclease/exonuclease/phosphatase family protein [Tannerella sp.]|jgi:endonuclease/exonuclease/phosphatase family metal-dependent hydrolase|nr:endonuclease/exonuclease/phosphatase family protein [Tannerella sp.]
MPYYKPIKRVKDQEERVRIAEKLLTLRSQLDDEIPQKTATETLLLATWNIREFGDNRRTESLHFIAEIISRFDLVAVQEVARQLDGIVKLMSYLGPTWDYIVTDSSEGTAGGGERMAFIYDKCKVRFKNIAGELVLQQTNLIKANKKVNNKVTDMIEHLQFARTPFCVAFQAGWFQFNLATVHIYYGSATDTQIEERRLKEIEKAVDFLSKRANDEGISYILLGDFNIPNCKTDYMKALQKKKFFVPDAIKVHPSNIGKSKHYDQIAFNIKLEDDMDIFDKKNQKAGAFDFTKSVYTIDDFTIYRPFFSENALMIKDSKTKVLRLKTEEELKKYYLSDYRTFEMSDHLPLWVELKIDFSNQYLKGLSV